DEAAGVVPELHRKRQRLYRIRLWWQSPGLFLGVVRRGHAREFLGSQLVHRLHAAFARPFSHTRWSPDGDARLLELGCSPRQQVRCEELVGRSSLLRSGRARGADVSIERRGFHTAVEPVPNLSDAELSASHRPTTIRDDVHGGWASGNLRLALRLRADRPEYVSDRKSVV